MWQRFITFQLDRRWCQSQSSRRSRRNFLHIREAVWALWRSVTDPHFTSTCKMRPKAICVSWWTCRTIRMSCFFRGAGRFSLTRFPWIWHERKRPLPLSIPDIGQSVPGRKRICCRESRHTRQHPERLKITRSCRILWIWTDLATTFTSRSTTRLKERCIASCRT